MSKAKIAITLESELLAEVDQLVREHRFPNRSQAIAFAIQEQIARIRRTRLAHACSLLDSAEERALADEGLAVDLADWPEY